MPTSSAVILAASCLAWISSPISAVQLKVRLGNAPSQGRVVIQIYDSANAFGDFRDPRNEIVLEARGDDEYSLGEIAGGDLAVLVYFDENANGFLDKNFIGIPTEMIGLSNGYRPKGPPSFERARIAVRGTDPQTIDIELYRVLGQRGRVGVGVGVVGRGSPYLDSTRSVFQVIPAITFNGERLQWLGPEVRYGILGSGRLRLAFSASYRLGVYEESDSPFLAGLGDREDTLLFGLGVQYEMPQGIDVALRYQLDALDRIGGGSAMMEISRGFQLGVARLQPQMIYRWSSSELANHDYGVPESGATPARPSYELGSVATWEIGITGFVEITNDWRFVFRLASEWLPGEVSRSPIVVDKTVLNGFSAITYVF